MPFVAERTGVDRRSRFLKDKRKTMAETKLLPADALEKNAPKVIPPLAGFWFRLGALLLDLFILRMALQVTMTVLRPVYFALGSASVLVGLAVAYSYLVLAEAKFGKGMTLGKAVLGIRTTDLEGEPAAARAITIRSAILLAVAIPFLRRDVTQYLLESGKPARLLIFPVLMESVGYAYILANIFLVVLHPLKQSVHDLAARTLVVRESGAHNLSIYLEGVAEQGEAVRRRAIQIAAVAFVGLATLFSFNYCKGFFSEEIQRQVRMIRSFQDEFNYGPFRAEVPWPLYSGEVVSIDALSSTTKVPESVIQANLDDSGATTTHVLEVGFSTNSAVRDEDYGTTGDMQALKKHLTDWVADQIQQERFPFDLETRKRYLRPRRGERRGEVIEPPLFQPRFVRLSFLQETRLLLCSKWDRIRIELQPVRLPDGFYQAELKAEDAGTKKPEQPGGEDDSTPRDRPTTGSR